MQRLRSKNPTILPIDTKIEWTIRQKPRDNVAEEEEEFKVKEMMPQQFVIQLPPVNPPPPAWKPMKQSFIPQNPTQPSCIAYQPEAEGNYYISLQILNVLTHFRGTATEDPHLHLREFIDICKFQHIQGLNQKEIKLILFPFFLERQC